MIKDGGYIALASVLVIAAVTFIIVSSVGLLTVNDLQTSLSLKQGSQAHYYAESCAEESLLIWNETNALPATVTFPEATCSVTINSQAGNQTTFTVTANDNSYTSSVQVTAERTTTVTIISWQQL